ncbi:hypothetical protein [Sinorhizobium meliloti]|uniref:hypothetical protein n=1 Tax=Rhizobium meliloti TaxID=382 RepID=UPI000FDA3743|nr:hypothetical protein [Sinorhizobium meliloti]RVO68332.1 hypothetical protein CN087_12705 [Sinorhizobium meliloti]
MSDEQERLMRQINADFDKMHQSINAGLRISWMPTGPGFRVRDLEKYEAFLDSTKDEQNEFLKTVHADELKFWRALQAARSAYLEGQSSSPLE